MSCRFLSVRCQKQCWTQRDMSWCVISERPSIRTSVYLAFCRLLESLSFMLPCVVIAKASLTCASALEIFIRSAWDYAFYPGCRKQDPASTALAEHASAGVILMEYHMTLSMGTAVSPSCDLPRINCATVRRIPRYASVYETFVQPVRRHTSLTPGRCTESAPSRRLMKLV